MSKALDHADAIVTRLQTAPAAGELSTAIDLTAIEIIVDRQKNIFSDIAEAVAKDSGMCVTILWNGWTVIDKNAATPRLAHSYTLSIYAQPVMDEAGILAADDVMESILRRLWQWIPAGYHANGECQVGSGSLEPDPMYLRYDCELVIPASL